MTPHDLIKHGPRQYECQTCSQKWQSRPRTKCPGLKVYPNHDYLPLMTKDQLGYSGYQTSKKSLPAPAGCYHSRAVGIYVMLYDPAQAVKKQGQPRPRTRTTITEIVWPVRSLPLIQSFSEFLRDRSLHMGRSYEDRANEVTNMIAHFAAFTPDEIAHLAGDCIHLTISPSLVRRAYPSFRVDTTEQTALAARVAAAYERHKATL